LIVTDPDVNTGVALSLFCGNILIIKKQMPIDHIVGMPCPNGDINKEHSLDISCWCIHEEKAEAYVRTTKM
jgi:hypothetical protein